MLVTADTPSTETSETETPSADRSQPEPSESAAPPIDESAPAPIDDATTPPVEDSAPAPSKSAARLDHSGSVLWLPPQLLEGARALANTQMKTQTDGSDQASKEDVVPDEATRSCLDPILDEDGNLDPMAAQLLQVVNDASLVVSIDLTYGTDSSNPVLWATPRQAIVTQASDAEAIELRPIDVAQIPQVMGQLLVLRRPVFVGEGPISVRQKVLAEAREMTERDEAIDFLSEHGLTPYEATLVLELQEPDLRRWRITTTWSTFGGPETAELAGIDAGPSGQWLATGVPQPDEQGIVVTYVPQSDGQLFAAMRQVLPRRWNGTALNPPQE